MAADHMRQPANFSGPHACRLPVRAPCFPLSFPCDLLVHSRGGRRSLGGCVPGSLGSWVRTLVIVAVSKRDARQVHYPTTNPPIYLSTYLPIYLSTYLPI